MQPSALSGVERYARLGSTEQLPQGLVERARAPIPQRSVNAAQRQTGDGSDSRRMGMEKKILPEGLDTGRVATQKAWHQMVLEQRHDR